MQIGKKSRIVIVSIVTLLSFGPLIFRAVIAVLWGHGAAGYQNVYGLVIHWTSLPITIRGACNRIHCKSKLLLEGEARAVIPAFTGERRPTPDIRVVENRRPRQTSDRAHAYARSVSRGHSAAIRAGISMPYAAAWSGLCVAR